MESKYNEDLQVSKKDRLRNFKNKVKRLKTMGKFNLMTSEKMNSITVCGDNTCTFLDFHRGKPILFYLIQKANKKHIKRYVSLFCFSFGFVRGYIPTCLFLGEIDLLPGNDWFEQIAFFVMNTSLIVFYSYLMRFIIQAYIDFSRKIFLMNQLEILISTERPKSKKYLPTFNLLDITTAYSWSKMRRIVKDYGRRMTVRHELLLPVIFMYMIFVYGFIWCSNLKVVNLNKELMESIIPFLYIDFTVLTILTLSLLYFAARVNWFYNFHIYKIEKIKKLIKEMYIFREHYFGIDRGEEYSMIKMQDDLIFEEDLSDPVI